MRKQIGDLRRQLRVRRLEEALLASAGAIPGSRRRPRPLRSLRLLEAMRRVTRGSSASRARFIHTAVVVSAYGSYEQFIEACIQQYVGRVEQMCPTFTDLPEALQSNHNRLSYQLIGKLGHSRFAGVVTEASVIANLHSCLTPTGPYRLNYDAIVLHETNLWSTTLADKLTHVGIDKPLKRIRERRAYSGYLAKKLGAASLTASDESAFRELNELIQWRNEAAHGDVQNTLSPELLMSILDYLEVLAVAISEVLQVEVWRRQYQQSGILLGSPVAVYRNEVVCVELANQRVRVGDIMVALVQGKEHPVTASRILEIQISNRPVVSAPNRRALKIGCKVGFHAKVNYQYGLIPASRDLLRNS